MMSKYYSFTLSQEFESIKVRSMALEIINGRIAFMERSGMLFGKWKTLFSISTVDMVMDLDRSSRMGKNKKSGMIILRKKQGDKEYRIYIYEELDAFISELELPAIGDLEALRT
ncbi:hypothetical protein [Marinomonas aquiplantarum]|nr:hypothetical protein [Marinomonas aquiplantarum]